MYLDHFGLHAAPFTLAQNLRFLYQSRAFQETMAHLAYGLEAGEDIVLITGEIGAGKTMALSFLTRNLDDAYQVALVNTTRVSFLELLKLLLGELGGTPPPGADRADMILALRGASAELQESGRKLLVIVDEAQNLDVETLEGLRLLTNVPRDGRQVCQLILAGQPGLRAAIDRPELAQLRQRIRVDYHLETLDAKETAAYLQHRLKVAGCEKPLFDDRAVAAIHQASGGIPRLVNVLADKALLSAFVDDASRVKAAHVPVEEVAAPPAEPAPPPHAAAAVAPQPEPSPPPAPVRTPPPAPPPVPARRPDAGMGRRLALIALSVAVIAALAWAGWTLLQGRTSASTTPDRNAATPQEPATEQRDAPPPPPAEAMTEAVAETVAVRTEQAPADTARVVQAREEVAEPAVQVEARTPPPREEAAPAPARQPASQPAAVRPARPAVTEVVIGRDEPEAVLATSGPRVQVGSFRNYERAVIMRNRLAWVSDRNTIVKTAVEGRIWYVVYSGPWGSVEEARDAERLIRRYDIADDTILVED
ncbi:MAG TPA: AAA family ATPase [Candidatus Krumholzibacteria bacterium]|nr:AAA family ATPase [Candidatus Krumholzibacteria bacterium]